jgi:hypothetical protein
MVRTMIMLGREKGLHIMAWRECGDRWTIVCGFVVEKRIRIAVRRTGMGKRSRLSLLVLEFSEEVGVFVIGLSETVLFNCVS